MRTAPKVISTVAAATILLGLTSLTVANAAPASATGAAVTASAATDGDMSASKVDSTRRFTITNFTGHTLTVDDIWGTTGWPHPKKTAFNLYDSYPVTGSVLKPGQQMSFEIKDWSNHGITVKFKADNGRDVHVYMHVSGVSRYSDAQGLEGQFVKGGGDVTILDKPGVVTIPASDPVGQAKTINTLCGQAAVTCKFKPTEEPDTFLGPAHPFGRGFANLTDTLITPTTEQSDMVETSTSLALSASVKATIMGAVEVGLTTEWKQEWKTSHTFKQTFPLPVGPGKVGWLTTQDPMLRVVGNLTITMNGSQTTWKMDGLVFDIPDHKEKPGMASAFSRNMTDDEIAYAWRTGGVIEAPWNNQFAGPALRVSVPGP